MAQAAEIITTENALDVLAIENVDVTPFLVDRDKRRDFMDRVREVGLTAGSDVSTAKARGEIIAMAAKVTKCKTAIDKAGLEMTENWRQQTAEVNAARKEVKGDFTQLAADIRRPVTEWEEAEKAREERVKLTLTELRTLVSAPAPAGASIELITKRVQEVTAEEIDPDVFGDDTEFAVNLKEEALQALNGALAAAEKAAAEQAELEELRREKAEREAREEAERRQREEEAAAKAKAEREAEEAKRREAEAEQRAAEAAEKARRDERERIEAEQRAQAEAEAKERAAAEKKAANAKHRERIRSDVAETLETRFELDPTRARAITAAIEAGEIPHTSIQF